MDHALGRSNARTVWHMKSIISLCLLLAVQNAHIDSLGGSEGAMAITRY